MRWSRRTATYYRRLCASRCSSDRKFRARPCPKCAVSRILPSMTLTADEIRSQPDLWRRVGADPVPDFLTDPGRRMLVVGCGTSAFMAMSYAVLREQAGMGE